MRLKLLRIGSYAVQTYFYIPCARSLLYARLNSIQQLNCSLLEECNQWQVRFPLPSPQFPTHLKNTAALFSAQPGTACHSIVTHRRRETFEDVQLCTQAQVRTFPGVLQTDGSSTFCDLQILCGSR